MVLESFDFYLLIDFALGLALYRIGFGFVYFLGAIYLIIIRFNDYNKN